MNVKAFICYLLITVFSLSHAYAQDDTLPNISEYGDPDGDRTFLIINSYNENSPWTRAMITPITYFIANTDGIHAELINLNSTLITDSVTYEKVKTVFLKKYAEEKVDYVVFIGQLAFTFREEIKDMWGDIPMLLITRDLTIAPPKYYFSGFDNPESDEDETRSIKELKSEFNFTAIYVPDYYKETIDLMYDMIPDMEELVFFSDAAYYNRNLSSDIEIYLLEQYPGIKYKWIQASEHNDLDLQYYLMHKTPTVGLLMSSWFYEKVGALGYPSLVMGDLNLLFSSANPVFSLRHAFLNLGAIGGVYSDPEAIHNVITNMVSDIVETSDARNIKIYSNRDNYQIMVKYPLLKDYGLQIGRCPKGTIFLDKPQTFWEKYYWQMIVMALLFAMLVVVFVRRNMTQRKEIEMLKRHKQFVEIMPVPYAKAKVKYNLSMEVINIEYTAFNEEFVKIIKANREKSKSYILFPSELISEKTSQMLETDKPLSFTYHFDKTDTYYVFTLCIIDRKTKDEREYANQIDIFAVDVTKRLKDEKYLRELTQRLDLTLSVANIIPWEWNIKDDVLYFGATDLFRRYDGRHVNEDPAKKDWSSVGYGEYISMVVQDDKQRFLKIREEIILRNIEEFHEEFRLKIPRHGKENEEWIDCSGAVSDWDADGQPLKVMGSMLLVTERKNQEMDLRRASERANEAYCMKSSFLTSMSHEIRTPLNAIMGFASLICDTDDPEKRKEYKRIITQNNDVLLNLLNDVLDLAKIESNTVDIQESTVDVNTLIHNVTESIRERLQKGVVLNVAFGAPRCVISADANRVSQVLMNLLSNACKYTPEGSITVGYDIIDGSIRFFVKDTGIGVSKDMQESLFRTSDRITERIKGNGMGLDISLSLVECMGGTMGMESRGEGMGSDFWFSIPYKPVEAEMPKVAAAENTSSEKAKNKDTEAESENQAADAPEKTNDKRPMILVAEDVDGNYLLIENLIPDYCVVAHAWNGREAVDMCRELNPDLVLMDVNMPILDGYKALSEIRAEGNEVPTVAITAYAYASDRRRILSSGFNDFLSKPLNPEALHEVICKYIHWG